MNTEKRAAYAEELKRSGICNCAQAVALALADQTAIGETALKQATAGFCAGMGTLEATCGALIGAGIVAGLATGGVGTLRITRMLLTRFKETCGATACRDLKATINGIPRCPCEQCVKNAVRAYAEVIGLQE